MCNYDSKMILIHIAGPVDSVKDIMGGVLATLPDTMILNADMLVSTDSIRSGRLWATDAWVGALDRAINAHIAAAEAAKVHRLIVVGSIFRSATQKVLDVYSPDPGLRYYMNVSTPQMLEHLYKQALRTADWVAMAEEGGPRIPDSAQVISDEGAIRGWCVNHGYTVYSAEEVLSLIIRACK
jgi:hypothetical protein